MKRACTAVYTAKPRQNDKRLQKRKKDRRIDFLRSVCLLFPKSGSSRIFVGLKVSRELFKGLRIPKAAPLVADRSRRNSGQYRTIAAHALLESYSVSLHINPLTCVSKSAVFLCNLTKNLTSQSAHPNLCGVALTTESAGGEPKQSGGLFWRGEPSPGVPRCEEQIPQFSMKNVFFMKYTKRI